MLHAIMTDLAIMACHYGVMGNYNRVKMTFFYFSNTLHLEFDAKTQESRHKNQDAGIKMQESRCKNQDAGIKTQESRHKNQDTR